MRRAIYWAGAVTLLLALIGTTALIGATPATAAPISAAATWAHLNAVASPPIRAGASMAYDAATGQMLLFGGFGSGVTLDDTWSWNGATWSQLFPAKSMWPLARTFAMGESCVRDHPVTSVSPWCLRTRT
ncbi:MAG: kelch repeat-containing protein [Acidimicrobiales bacterium]|jgi:hypothetical protein